MCSIDCLVILKVMEEVGIKPKRLAGASAGAICSALFAVGYNVHDIEKVLQEDMEYILLGQ